MSPPCLFCIFAVWSWVLILLTGFVSADKVDDSCKAPKEYTKDGKLYSVYRSIFEDVTEALDEVFKMQKEASDLVEKYEKGNGLSWFDKDRVLETYITFQGDEWEEENPSADEIERPADAHITKQKRWSDFKNSLEKYGKGLHGQGRPWKILCGQEHLEKYWIDKDGKRRSTPGVKSKGDIGFQYYDTYLKDWWTRDQEGCSGEDIHGRAPMMSYVMLCPDVVLDNGVWEIGDKQRTTDWAAKKPDEHITAKDLERARKLDFWSQYLSYTLVHELAHVLLIFRDHALCDGTQAYEFDGTQALIAQSFNMVPTNVDNFGYPLLAWYMKANEWSSGKAQNEAQIQG